MAFVHSDEKHVENLRKSVETVGYLYPALRKKGTTKILSGNSRLKADPKWPIKDVEVTDELEEEKIILDSNIHREIPEEEICHRLLRMAQILLKRGVQPEMVSAELSKELHGRYSADHITKHLPAEYRGQPEKRREVSSATKQLLSDTKKDGENAKEAVAGLVNDLELEKKSYSIMSGCLCSGCPNKDECF